MTEHSMNAELVRESAKATLAKNLILARTAKEMTQDAVAEASGLSRATIAQIESGDSDPHLSTIIDLARALETSPLLLLLHEQELTALINVAREAQSELLQNRVSNKDVEMMRRLIQTGMMKNRLRAAKIGIGAMQAAGLAAGTTAIGAAIGSSLLPGIGTVIGALLGSLLNVTSTINKPEHDLE